MATFNIKQNDTSPAILYALTPTTVNLGGAAVQFRMREVGSTTWTLTDDAVVVTATVTPTVRYDWAVADTATPGFYEAEFVVTYSDDTIETFPNSEFITINIVGDETGLSERINNVRFLIGDTDSSDYAITNDNVSFALTQAGDDVYLAAAICARALAGKYATYVDTKVESVSSSYSQLSENYYKLATRLEAQSKKYGSKGLGVPAAGGLTYTDMDAADEDTDRVKPKFRQDQFAWPPRDPYDYPYST
jgi:hypothetical protein